MENNILLNEILRPKTIEQLILPPRIKSIIGDGSLKQNFLFYGGAGLGKTSAAKVLASKYPYIYINCSDETGVDTVREKINKWCSTISVLDGAESIKVVILDEIDGVSEQFFKALRGTIEKFAEQARFIGTCNYFNKIPDTMHSRFTLINFDFLDKEEEQYVYNEQVNRAKIVLTKLNISHTSEAVEELVKRSLPDMRKLFNKIQTLQISGVKELTKAAILKTEWSFEDIFIMCTSTPDPYKNYIFMINQYGSRVEDVLSALGNEFPKWLEENHPSKINSLPAIIVEIASHQAQRVHVIDPAVSMLSCIFKIQMILNSSK
jgi:DNA polymerase III delta prime subunit